MLTEKGGGVRLEEGDALQSNWHLSRRGWEETREGDKL